MKKTSKKFISLLLAVVMVFAMSATVFAAGEPHKAALYKAGTYGTDKQEASMGNGAITGATVEKIEGGYRITVHLDEDFKAYGIKSNMEKVTVEGVPAKMVDVAGVKGKNEAFVFDYMTTDENAFPHKFSASFTLKALIMPINAEGDLVIF